MYACIHTVIHAYYYLHILRLLCLTPADTLSPGASAKCQHSDILPQPIHKFPIDIILNDDLVLGIFEEETFIFYHSVGEYVVPHYFAFSDW